LIRPADGNDAAAEEALLFAGGGIVADSHADRELEETRIKLRALLAPLTEI
jgi:isochorismate synthase EntC